MVVQAVKNILFTLIFVTSVFADSYKEKEAEMFKMIASGIEQMSLENYEEAQNTFRKVIKMDTESPNGYLLMATTFHNLMADYRNLKFTNQFNYYINLAIEKAQKRIDQNFNLARSYQYLGAAYGFKGLREASLGNFFQAFKDGLNGLNALETALEINPNIDDAYYGTGVYHYWRAKKAGALKYLIFLGDSREKGIEEIKRAGKGGEVCSQVSVEALIRIYQAEEDYNNFFKIVNQTLIKYPKDIYARWYLGETLTLQKRWKEALEVYQKIEELLNEPFGKENAGIEAWIELWYFKGLCYFNLGNKTEAKKMINKVLEINPKNYDKRIFVQDFVELSEKLKTKLQ
ncbi:tetratricopeptide repeat protein [bacterium]|nr:tetratricopeptide repeat protein [bacterium]